MYPARRSLLDVVFGHPTESILESRLRRLVRDWPPGGLLRLMPYTLNVQ
jgi:hypothetical protein